MLEARGELLADALESQIRVHEGDRGKKRRPKKNARARFCPNYEGKNEKKKGRTKRRDCVQEPQHKERGGVEILNEATEPPSEGESDPGKKGPHQQSPKV